MSLKGLLFVISAPSGAGKTSLVRALREDLGEIGVSVSHTTRPMRPGEENGRDYHYVSQDEFDDLVEQGAFVEHATVFGNSYGTSRQSIDEVRNAGQDVVLEIDWQGARQIRSIWPDCISIFILPPSRAALKERLTKRGQDDESVIANRMAKADQEMAHFKEYDYLILNDDFETARRQLASVILADRLKLDRQMKVHRDVLNLLT